MAAAPAEGTHVVMALTGANGVVFHFAFEPEIAMRLRSEIEIPMSRRGSFMILANGSAERKVQPAEPLLFQNSRLQNG